MASSETITPPEADVLSVEAPDRQGEQERDRQLGAKVFGGEPFVRRDYKRGEDGGTFEWTGDFLVVPTDVGEVEFRKPNYPEEEPADITKQRRIAENRGHVILRQIL